MLLPEDYLCIGIVAKHCDNTKLCVAENEALNFDLSELFCDFWNDILIYWQEVDAYDMAVSDCDGNIECIESIPEVENYADKKALIYGGTFLNCSEKLRPFAGVKKILAYYSYSRYIILNGFSDTPSGMVQKTNEFSIPKSLKELEMFADKYRNMGKITFDNTVSFLCNKKEVFVDYNSYGCVGCGCACEKCSGTTRVKGYGIRGSNITKRL